MIIYSKNDGSQLDIADAMASFLSVTLEPGESFDLNTPLGPINIERTGDTFSITDWEGMVCFSAESTNNVWSKQSPLTNEEAERRQAAFDESERRCR